MVSYRTHHPGDIIDHHKQDQHIQQAIAAAEKPSKPAAHPGEYHLNRVPKFLHDRILAFFLYEKREAAAPNVIKLR